MKEIALTRGYVTVVDDGDFEWLSSMKWHVIPTRGKFYARNSRGVYMHRLLVGGDSPEVDHKDGDGLNNRRENLRPVTHKQNQQNRSGAYGASGYRGVQLYRGRSGKGTKWQARAKVDGRTRSFGYFDTPEEAAVAAEAGRRAVWG
jgi:hypothetical protein